MFVGVYEPTKQILLESLPENLNALAHLVRFTTNHASVYNIHQPWQMFSLCIYYISLLLKKKKPIRLQAFFFFFFRYARVNYCTRMLDRALYLLI